MFFLVKHQKVFPVDNWSMAPVGSKVGFGPTPSDTDHFIIEAYGVHVKPDETTDTYVFLKDGKEWERDQRRRATT